MSVLRPQHKPWTRSEEYALEEYMVRGWTYVEMAKKFGRSRSAVRAKAIRMGLVPPNVRMRELQMTEIDEAWEREVRIARGRDAD